MATSLGSPALKSAAAAAAAASASVPSLTQKIFTEVYNTYTGEGERVPVLEGLNRLEEIAKDAHLSPPLLHPRKRVTVMILGNHSAGKSSFINWYCEQDVLATGVAVESAGFTVITHGRDTTPIKGEGTIMENKHLSAVAERLGKGKSTFVEYLSTVHVTKPAREMGQVYLIDTPGLVDGDMVYPFDVNRTIAELAEVCDLIFVFLDPIGQALVSRTMNVVKDLNVRGHFSKMRYVLTKADTVARPADLNKVIVQVTQNLASRVTNTHAFDIPCIWLPTTDAGASDRQPPSEVNSLPKLCDTISRAVQRKVQDNMERAEADCRRLLEHLESELDALQLNNRIRRKWSCYTWLLAPLLLALATFAFLDVLLALEPRLPAAVRDAPLMMRVVDLVRPPFDTVLDAAAALGWGAIGQRLQLVGAAFLLLSFLSQFFQCRMRGLRTKSNLPRGRLLTYRSDVDALKRHVELLHSRYSSAPKIAGELF